MPARTTGSAAEVQRSAGRVEPFTQLRSGELAPCEASGELSCGKPGMSTLCQVWPPFSDLKTPSHASPGIFMGSFGPNG